MKKKLSFAMLVALVVVLVAVPAFAKTSVESADEDGKVNVTFTYEGNLDANAVFVAGEMNNWSPNHPFWRMKKKDGAWTITKKLDQGEKYQYKFTVYGGGELKWVKDEDAATFTGDGFGGQNSVLIAKTTSNLEPRIVELEKKMATVNIGFNYHGYARAGYILTSGGGKANSALPSSFRLGNETDLYLEHEFNKKWSADDGSWMKAGFMTVNKNSGNNHWDDDTQNVIPQAYVEGGGFDFAPDLTFWAGEKYYGRSDIHITDFYWRDMTGFGGGVKGIDLGNATLDAAFIGHSEWGNSVIDEVGTKSVKNIDLRFKGIEVPGGKLEVELTPKFVSGGSYTKTTEKVKEGTGVHKDTDDDEQFDEWVPEETKEVTETINVDDRSSVGLAVVYTRPDFYGMDGSSTYALQYGEGLSANLGKAHGTSKNEDDSSLRLLTYGVGDLSENWSVMPQFVYQLDDPANGDKTTTITTGARFVNAVTNHFAMQYEIGYDYKDSDSMNDAATVAKLTVAPTIKWDTKGFWSRPELRTFVSYATGDNEDFGPEYDDESGVTYGVQTELWW